MLGLAHHTILDLIFTSTALHQSTRIISKISIRTYSHLFPYLFKNFILQAVANPSRPPEGWARRIPFFFHPYPYLSFLYPKLILSNHLFPARGFNRVFLTGAIPVPFQGQKKPSDVGMVLWSNASYARGANRKKITPCFRYPTYVWVFAIFDNKALKVLWVITVRSVDNNCEVTR